MHKLQSQQIEYAAGNDPYLNQCLALLSDALQRRELADLSMLARATQTLEDDALINDLRVLKQRDTELRRTLGQHQEMHHEHLRRVQELEQVRGNFKRKRYDDLRSVFQNGELLVTLMSQVLGGATSGSALWDALKRSQRYHDVAGAWPDFGSGGVVLGRHGPG